eukprot:m.97775 g.97775  ORF g.97775 m.97775 type:complete len:354 (+) comp15236_c1_seq1:118-1179(+)
MSLWVDKHRPKTFDKLSYHLDQAEDLRRLAATGDIPHLLVYGPSGAGKKTRIMCLLREIYGPAVERLKIEHRSFKAASKTLEINTLASNFHIEINPSDVGNSDDHVVRTLLKEIAISQQLDASHRAFKVVVLSEADQLSKKAQQALRRIMEKYVSSCRYILCCNSASKLIPAIRSRCLGVRVAAPSEDQIVQVLTTVGKKEMCPIPVELATRIAQQSQRNLRKAVLMMEACRVQESPLRPDQKVVTTDWEEYLKDTALRILDSQTPARLLEVRGRMYELLSHCIPADVIIKGLTSELVSNLDVQLKVDVTRHAAEYEHRLQCGRKPIYHLEAFVAKFMAVYKRWAEGLTGDFY